MKKNIAIVLLAVALAASLMLFCNQCVHGIAMQAANRNVRLAGYRVWSQACQHAAAGSPARAKWCAWSENQTTISATEEGVSDEAYEALAAEVVTREMLAGKAAPVKISAQPSIH